MSWQRTAKKDPASAAGGSRAGKSILEGFLQDSNAALHRSVKFVVVIILEQNQIVLVLRVGEVLWDGKVAPAQILIPVSQLPSVAVRVALDHSLVDDLGRGFDPDDGQRRALGGQLGLQVCDKGVVAHLLGERRVDQDNIVVVQCLHGQGQNAVILIIADVLLEKRAAAVIRLPGNLEDLLGEDDERILVEVDNVL